MFRGQDIETSAPHIYSTLYPMYHQTEVAAGDSFGNKGTDSATSCFFARGLSVVIFFVLS